MQSSYLVLGYGAVPFVEEPEPDGRLPRIRGGDDDAAILVDRHRVVVKVEMKTLDKIVLQQFSFFFADLSSFSPISWAILNSFF